MLVTFASNLFIAMEGSENVMNFNTQSLKKKNIFCLRASLIITHLKSVAHLTQTHRHTRTHTVTHEENEKKATQNLRKKLLKTFPSDKSVKKKRENQHLLLK